MDFLGNGSILPSRVPLPVNDDFRSGPHAHIRRRMTRPARIDISAHATFEPWGWEDGPLKARIEAASLEKRRRAEAGQPDAEGEHYLRKVEWPKRTVLACFWYNAQRVEHLDRGGYNRFKRLGFFTVRGCEACCKPKKLPKAEGIVDRVMRLRNKARRDKKKLCSSCGSDSYCQDARGGQLSEPREDCPRYEEFQAGRTYDPQDAVPRDQVEDSA